MWPALNRTPTHVCSASLKNLRKLHKWRTKTIYDSWTEACQITQELKWKGNRSHILVSNFWCKLAVFGYPLHELAPNHGGGVCASHIEGFCFCLLAVTPKENWSWVRWKTKSKSVKDYERRHCRGREKYWFSSTLELYKLFLLDMLCLRVHTCFMFPVNHCT